MNNIIKDQLSKVKNADLSHFDQNLNTYFIPRNINIEIECGNYYLIELDDSLIDINNTSLDALTKNWNNGNKPKSKYYKIDVNKIYGDMIYVTGIGCDQYEKDLQNCMFLG